MTEAIKLTNFRKSYGGFEVIKGLSLDIKKGEIFALLGINGAGKTTTLECIENLRPYSEGAIIVNGKIGIQLQSSTLPPSIKVKEAAELYCRWNKVGINKEQMDTLGISRFRNKLYKELSTGQKRRLHLFLSLIGDPDILFLDEPTAGLDVEGRMALHAEMKRLNAKGKTIILASHDMAEIEQLCHRIGILKDGKLIFTGTAQELTARSSKKVRIHVKSSSAVEETAYQNITYTGSDGGYAVYESSHVTEGLLELLETIKKNNILIEDIRLEHMSLEQSFLDISKEGTK